MTDTPEKPSRAKLEQVRQAAALHAEPANSNLVQPSGMVPPPVPAHPSMASSSFSMIAKPAQPEQRKIVGGVLKFVKGDWVADRGARILPSGTEMVVRDVRESLCFFRQQQIVHEIFRVSGALFPARDELPAMFAGSEFADLVTLDKARWPLGPSGKPSDPVQHSFYLWLFDFDAMADFTFISSTIGGLRAVRQLCREIAYKQEMADGAEVYAVIALTVGRRNSRAYGVVLEPDFPIQHWVGPDMRPLAGGNLAGDLDDNLAY
jgi:hypothetical protein